MTQRTYPSYWLYKDNRGEYRWTYEASNGLTIAVSSEGYKKRSDCERGIAGLAHGEIERIPAPDVDLPGVAGKVLELDGPMEAGAQRMRLDIIVDVGRLVEAEADALELGRQVAAEIEPLLPAV